MKAFHLYPTINFWQVILVLYLLGLIAVVPLGSLSVDPLQSTGASTGSSTKTLFFPLGQHDVGHFEGTLLAAQRLKGKFHKRPLT